MADPANYYFNNPAAEALVTRYVEGACTDLALRNEIMDLAVPVIRGLIRKQNLHVVFSGVNGSAFEDLVHVAWLSIERALYKFDASPGHAKLFSFWTQIAWTSVLAHIKKNTRDRRNKDKLQLKRTEDEGATRPKPDLDYFIERVRQVCSSRFDPAIDALVKVIAETAEHNVPIKAQIMRAGGVPGPLVKDFLKVLRSELCQEFSMFLIGRRTRSGS